MYAKARLILLSSDKIVHIMETQVNGETVADK